jgi:hypothetical protein
LKANDIEVNNLVVFSDPHAGCKLGLCPDEPVPLDEGGAYQPSEFQKIVWGYWREFWDVWVPDVTRGEPYAVCLNGDALDGRHHGAVTQISQNLADQTNLAGIILRPIVDKCEGRYYHIRGTEAHVGPSGEDEERLARSLGSIPNSIGQYARNEAWFRIGGDYLIHVAHHIGTTSATAYESSALMRELSEAYVEAAKWNEQPPSVVVRSHRHRFTEVRIQTARGFATVCTTPGWQGKTPFVYRIAGGRMATPQFVGIQVRAGDEDIYTRSFVKSVRRSAEVEL